MTELVERHQNISNEKAEKVLELKEIVVKLEKKIDDSSN
jgi:hypothetical protein